MTLAAALRSKWRPCGSRGVVWPSLSYLLRSEFFWGERDEVCLLLVLLAVRTICSGSVCHPDCRPNLIHWSRRWLCRRMLGPRAHLQSWPMGAVRALLLTTPSAGGGVPRHEHLVLPSPHDFRVCGGVQAQRLQPRAELSHLLFHGSVQGLSELVPLSVWHCPGSSPERSRQQGLLAALV